MIYSSNGIYHILVINLENYEVCKVLSSFNIAICHC